MRRIYAAQNLMMVGFLKEMLESEGMRCFIKNELLGGGAGELPVTECWPELWIVHDRDFARAHGRIEEILAAEGHARPGWRCPHCDESLEGQFTQCWRCGRLRGDHG
ncbi:MAG: DUF2007 domain-containing protein [Gammaproteobacteria bacterium]